MRWLRRPFLAVAEALVLILLCVTLAAGLGALVGTWGFLEGWLSLVALIFFPPTIDQWGGRIVFLVLVAVTYYVEPDAKR